VPRVVPTSEMSSPFAVFVAASNVHDTPALRDLVESYISTLRGLGGTTRDRGAPEASLPLVVFVATGGTEREILQRVQREAGEPVLLVAHPGQNSLPAALEVLARVQQLGRQGRILYLRDPGDGDGLRDLVEAIRDRRVWRALRDSRIGLVGEPSDWLVASSPALEVVRTAWGPTVVPIPLESILAAPDEESLARGESVASAFRRGAEALVEPAEPDLLAAGRVYGTLYRLVQAERLDAVAVRCFDLVVRQQTTGCLALARLAEDGIVAGCEGDLVATVAMLWIYRMLGTASWMANPSRIDPDRGTLSLAHCTVPRSMCGPYRLRSHFESGLGVGIQGEMSTGPVTLVRIGGLRLERLWVVDGMLVGNTDHPDLCRTQVEVEIGRDALKDLLARPLGNHVVVAPGHHAATLGRWHEAMGEAR
jgi:L-fucose isomerase-like protein